MSEFFAICFLAAVVMLGFAGLAWLADLPSAEDWLGDDDE